MDIEDYPPSLVIPDIGEIKIRVVRIPEIQIERFYYLGEHCKYEGANFSLSAHPPKPKGAQWDAFARKVEGRVKEILASQISIFAEVVPKLHDLLAKSNWGDGTNYTAESLQSQLKLWNVGLGVEDDGLVYYFAAFDHDLVIDLDEALHVTKIHFEG